MKNNVACQSYSGATLSTLMEKVQIYDLKNFKDIIVYVAGNDASQDYHARAMLGENIRTEYIEELYEKLILLIKKKNPVINIYLCSICPHGDTDVDNVNDAIKELSEIHNCVYVDINKTLYNKYDQLKSNFYKPRDNIHLSPSGTRGLLGCINQHTDIVESFKLCAYSKQSTLPSEPREPQSHRCHHLWDVRKHSQEGEIMLSHPGTGKRKTTQTTTVLCDVLNVVLVTIKHLNAIIKNNYRTLFANFMATKILFVGIIRKMANMPS